MKLVQIFEAWTFLIKAENFASLMHSFNKLPNFNSLFVDAYCYFVLLIRLVLLSHFAAQGIVNCLLEELVEQFKFVILCDQ
jgi:hypothetical protein